jgi:cell division protein FtsW
LEALDNKNDRRPSDEERLRAVKKEQMSKFKKMGPMDLPFMILVLLILSVGIVMMFSASYAAAYYVEDSSTHYLVKQGLLGLAGIAIMLVVSRMNYQWFRFLSIPALAASIVFLILVLFIGTEINGAKRWIYIGPINFQPSEIAKLAIILSFSSILSVNSDKLKSFKGSFRYCIMPMGGILLVICALLYKEPHISGIVLMVAVGGTLMFAGGLNWTWIAGAVATACTSLWYIMTHMAHSLSRIQIWKNPYIDPKGDGYQIIQSLIAVGSGGLLGLGLGKSRQKYLYLPEQHNDFVFAVVCEELGFVGACIVLLLFAILIMRGYWIAIHARDKFGSLLVTGIITLLAVQTFLNVAVVTNFIPVTGVSLPFFSYGGTSLMIQLAEMGIVLSVSRQMRED